jgi:glycosyltransferase involved in cell wall biosynthesis
MINPLSKVSIVLPTYNGARYLRRSIDSCLNQTHENIELIVVDDGSTDDTPSIVASTYDRRIAYLRHEANCGLPTALNAGFEQATGDYLTWTSDDNFYAGNAIERMLSFLRNGKHDFVYCDFYRFTRDDLSDLQIVKLPDDPTLQEENHIGPCFLYSKQVKDGVGDYSQDTALSEDYDYWIRVSKKFSMHHLAEPLYFYRHHLASLPLPKYCEIQIVGSLVRLRNEIQDIDDATESLLRLKSQMHQRRRARSRVLKPFASRSMGREAARTILSTQFVRRIYGVMVDRSKGGAPASTSIRRVLTDFSTRKLEFKEAKHAIADLIIGESGTD